MESNSLMIHQDHPMNDILGVRMYTSIMGTFHICAPINYIISNGVRNTYEDFYLISNKIDPWILSM